MTSAPDGDPPQGTNADSQIAGPDAQDDGPDMADRAFVRRRREDAAVAVPFLGAALLLTPLLEAISGLDRLFGVPAAIVYVFAVWAGLILLTRGISRRLTAANKRG